MPWVGGSVPSGALTQPCWTGPWGQHSCILSPGALVTPGPRPILQDRGLVVATSAPGRLRGVGVPPGSLG